MFTHTHKRYQEKKPKRNRREKQEGKTNISRKWGSSRNLSCTGINNTPYIYFILSLSHQTNKASTRHVSDSAVIITGKDNETIGDRVHVQNVWHIYSYSKSSFNIFNAFQQYILCLNGSLKENGHHRLSCLNTWSPVGKTNWEGLGRRSRLWGFKRLRPFLLSPFLPCLCLKMWFLTVSCLGQNVLSQEQPWEIAGSELV